MWFELVVSTALGLVVGLLTGFYFERRATRSAREYSALLERELDTLRTSIYTVGGGPSPTAAQPPPSDTTLEAMVYGRARQTQNADGRVRKNQLTAHFLAQGHGVEDIEAAVAALGRSAKVEDEGTWLLVR